MVRGAMRAVLATEPTPPAEDGAPPVMHLVSGDTPTPAPGPGQILVAVHYASVNPVDVAMAQGTVEGTIYPVCLGCDFSGKIEAVGAGVEGFAVGDRVFGSPPLGSVGTFASHVVALPRGVAKIPKGLTYAFAAALPTAGLIAHQALFRHGGLRAGERVFVAGVTGGAGTLAVGLAKRAGAFVAGSGPAVHRETMHDLGLDLYVSDDLDGDTTEAEGFDLAVDFAGNEATLDAARRLKEDGRLVSSANPDARGAVHFGMEPDPEVLREIGEAVAKEEVVLEIEGTYAYAEAQDALLRQATGEVAGKLLLKI